MNKNMNKNFYKFILLCSGSFIAAVGSGMTAFGLGIYVFEQTGLASATTLVMLLGFLPGLLLTPLAGILADRYERRLLMIMGDGLSALGLIYIFLCMQGGGAQLWQIGIGVTVSSVFSSLIEPAFKSTVTDLLTKEEYSKASGLVQLINSARFLISPVVAGALLAIADIKLLLLIDIGTIIITVIITFVVRSGLAVKKITGPPASLRSDFKEGWAALRKNRGVLLLTVTGIFISLFMGCVQSLYTPMLLGFTSSSVLGAATSVCASGMLLGSVFLGVVSIKKGFVRMMTAALFSAGAAMVGFGSRENIVVVCIFGFLFFAMLPFANTAIDYLIRINIPNEVQGRVWGLIGIISQLGYIAAYAVLGPLADYVFVPLLKENGALAGSVGQIIGTGNGRGIGLLIIMAGLLLALTAVLLGRMRAIRAMEG